jgi:hypothetical protein
MMKAAGVVKTWQDEEHKGGAGVECKKYSLILIHRGP